MKPSISRDVHYLSHGTPYRSDNSQVFPSRCRAAKVTDVHDDGTIDVCVFNPSGLFFQHNVNRDDTAEAGGTWHWPERVND